MTPLAIDFGTKHIGLAYALNGVIFTLPSVDNTTRSLDQIQKIISDYFIDYIYVGVSDGSMAKLTLAFVDQLSSVIKFPIETVEEAVSTIEAQDILLENKIPRKLHKKLIDSASAAVILRRVID